MEMKHVIAGITAKQLLDSLAVEPGERLSVCRPFEQIVVVQRREDAAERGEFSR